MTIKGKSYIYMTSQRSFFLGISNREVTERRVEIVDGSQSLYGKIDVTGEFCPGAVIRLSSYHKSYHKEFLHHPNALHSLKPLLFIVSTYVHPCRYLI